LLPVSTSTRSRSPRRLEGMGRSEKFTRPVRRQLDDLGISGKAGAAFWSNPLWTSWRRAPGVVWSSTRSVGQLCDPGIAPGKGSRAVLERLIEQAVETGMKDTVIAQLLSARPAPPEEGSPESPEEEERVSLRAPSVHVKGPASDPQPRKGKAFTGSGCRTGRKGESARVRTSFHMLNDGCARPQSRSPPRFSRPRSCV